MSMSTPTSSSMTRQDNKPHIGTTNTYTGKVVDKNQEVEIDAKTKK